LRIRVTSLPEQGEFEEIDFRRFRVGGVYDVTAQLASLLIILGRAEPISGFGEEGVAADTGFRPRSKT